MGARDRGKHSADAQGRRDWGLGDLGFGWGGRGLGRCRLVHKVAGLRRGRGRAPCPPGCRPAASPPRAWRLCAWSECPAPREALGSCTRSPGLRRGAGLCASDECPGPWETLSWCTRSPGTWASGGWSGPGEVFGWSTRSLGLQRGRDFVLRMGARDRGKRSAAAQGRPELGPGDLGLAGARRPCGLGSGEGLAQEGLG